MMMSKTAFQIGGTWLLVLFPGVAAAVTSAVTPIEHVIVIVGENRTFDNLFGVYEPKSGQSISNLLSRGIVTRGGQPGKNFHLAAQQRARNIGAYSPTPRIESPYLDLPQPFSASTRGQRSDIPDKRFPVAMANGPFQITHHVSYGAYTGDPMHRFFQMWQQVNGGKNDLFVWTAESVGVGPSNNAPAGLKPGATFQGGVSMGFYNMVAGDAPYFKALADSYAIADNYHQSVMGGTTANYFALATGDVAVYNENGKLARPPINRIENPDAQANTNNWYINDGYDGGTYVNCADETQAGVAGIRKLLDSLPYSSFRSGNCESGAYYMVNNLNPAYTPDGKTQKLGPEEFLMPPQTIPHIGDVLSAAGIHWKWYAGGRGDGVSTNDYCATCDPLTTFTSTMTGSDIDRLNDLSEFYVDVKDAATFPAFSVIAPHDSVSGHPGYSVEPSFDYLVRDVVERVRSNKDLWRKTAILVTFDEGGGYYDSGYIQFIDFFGDGPRVPLIAISPFAKTGFVDHTYYDHASILKFVQHNWSLNPLSPRSRDNLPNPKMGAADQYAPLNRPAIGDLMNLFDFKKAKTSK